MTVPLWCLLGYVAWTLLLLLGIGAARSAQVLTGARRANEFPAGERHGGDAYWRLNRAHLNCLEFIPLFTLHELRRVLAPGGWLYAEMPAPDTSCRHQTNPNHYSVLGRSAWIELVQRAGFAVREVFDIRFQVQAGPDEYWGLLAEVTAGAEGGP